MAMEARDDGAELLPIEWTLPERIRKIRRTFGMDQTEFGALFGKSDKAVSTWETGRNQPDNLVAFALRVEKLAAERGKRIPWTWVIDGRELTLPTDLTLTTADGPYQRSFDDLLTRRPELQLV